MICSRTTSYILMRTKRANVQAPVPSTSTSINNVIDEKTSNGAVDANNNNPTQESAAVLDETSTPPLDLATSAYGEPILLPEINDTSAVQPDDSGGQPSTSNQEAATEDAGSGACALCPACNAIRLRMIAERRTCGMFVENRMLYVKNKLRKNVSRCYVPYSWNIFFLRLRKSGVYLVFCGILAFVPRGYGRRLIVRFI